ncbi:MAG: hypothetical protein EOR51_12075 [Mesorhizobium sp.]|uniref:right-handed parallel beta-helix repeat-containing protein n=1 Tax=Mesorhizobium sp. TaxID=1871066 RepID=UPI000FE62A38|nr:right-handed parallel beta-helix repeat-containing protein [Mesorhizobium sp.]RWK79640.1 MAG: hypothetical protein EOR50_05805 [Mesorhizobium sp.]RWK82416.1 MAG: hypothetical protein EOR51_12075 [Mesorhizobium sp.]RWL08765.1 MAG: hypothetical protein EOR55_03475 [Mesorhizobium sp.]
MTTLPDFDSAVLSVMAVGKSAPVQENVPIASGEDEFLTGTAISLLAGTSVNGLGSVIKTTTASHHLLSVAAAGTRIADLKLEGTNGSTVLNNSGVVFGAGATDGKVINTELTGMSGMAVYATGGATDGLLSGLYVHDLSGSYQNSSDIGLYTNAHRFIVANSVLDGGAGIEVGVLQQLNSTGHKVTFNYIGAHTTYGAIDYETTPRATRSLFMGNTVEDIDGATLGGTSGAGYYAVATGGQIVAFNHFKNTNISTTTETLAPGAIGINDAYSPILINGNQVEAASWYGTMVVSNTDAIVSIVNNAYLECLKTAIYIKSSSDAVALGNSITALTPTPLTQRGIAVNVVGGGPFSGVSTIANRIRGTGGTAIDYNVTNNALVASNNISETAGGGLKLAGGAGAVVSGNMVDVSAAATGVGLVLSNQTYTMVSGNVFKATNAKVITIAGTCTGTRIDRSNVIVGQANPMNFIENNGTGCIVEMWGTAPPTVLQHQVGDTVWNSAPAVGQPIGWKCTAAGVPGTWTAMANL